MSFILSSVKQIRFPVESGAFGRFQLVINRPGTTALSVAATDTLLLANDDTDFPSPFLLQESEVQLQKKLISLRGDRSLDNVTFKVRDSLTYNGTINGVLTTEDLSTDFQTFFDIWLSDAGHYPCFILWRSYSSPALPTPVARIGMEGTIDPTYRPISNPNVINAGTSSQIFLGDREIKIIASGDLNQTLFSAVLANIGPSDCQSGTPYNGFFIAPQNYQGQSWTRDTIFGSGSGKFCLGVPYRDYQNVLQTLPAAVWPSIPWVSNTPNQIVRVGVGGGGFGYNINDVLIVAGGTGGTVTVVAVGIAQSVTSVVVTTPGTGYSTGTFATTGGSGTGAQVHITQVGNSTLYGPSGHVFISAGTLLAKCAQTLGLTTFNPATDLVSALDFFAQKADNTNKNYPVDPTPIPLTNLWLSLNVFAKAHPADGSYWDNPLGFSPDTPIATVVDSLLNFLLCSFNEIWANDGSRSLQLKALGATPLTLPDWQLLGVASQEDSSSSPRIVQVNNKQDSLKIACPIGITGDSVTVETLLRLHRIAATSGLDFTPDTECLILDSSKKDFEQAEECFKVMWQDASDATNYVVNPNTWKSLACAFWFNASNTNAVYGSNWSPFNGAASWANSFYAVNACYQSGQTPPANLQAVEKGNDYFNSRCYHAVAFAALALANGTTTQVFSYAGVADSIGSLQNITDGIAGTWRLGSNAAQPWRGFEVTQSLYSGITQIKYQPQDSAFPQLTDIPYGIVGSGGTSSSSGGGTSSSSGGGGNNPTPTASAWPYIPITIAGAGTQAIPNTATINVCNDNTTTGVSVAFGAVGNVITIYNRTGNTFTTGDFKLADSTAWTAMFMEAGVQFDPLLKTGWALISHNP